jgi:hypothetical protein
VLQKKMRPATLWFQTPGNSRVQPVLLPSISPTDTQPPFDLKVKNLAVGCAPELNIGERYTLKSKMIPNF